MNLSQQAPTTISDARVICALDIPASYPPKSGRFLWSNAYKLHILEGKSFTFDEWNKISLPEARTQKNRPLPRALAIYVVESEEVVEKRLANERKTKEAADAKAEKAAKAAEPAPEPKAQPAPVATEPTPAAEPATEAADTGIRAKAVDLLAGSQIKVHPRIESSNDIELLKVAVTIESRKATQDAIAQRIAELELI